MTVDPEQVKISRDGNSKPGSFAGMAWIADGTFQMGSSDFYPEERPVHHVSLDGFWIDKHPVTNLDFQRFVEKTGYVTIAERSPNPADYPGIDPSVLVPGSLVFHRPQHRVDLRNPSHWWTYVPGASWKHPEGPASTVDDRATHPVVHIAYEDAAAYADSAGKSLPTEAEWEFAARGGLEGAKYVWGDEFALNGQMMANTWQGEFPWQNLKSDGYEGTSPVGIFPSNGYGLFDMAGNVWEWTSDFFALRQPQEPSRPCCAPHNPRVDSLVQNLEFTLPDAHIPRKVVKGGSHLCAPNYCLRYRPAARQSEAVETSTSHIGFRCIVRVQGSGAH
jgi:formylglycine-generating enzyme required for sulfatase activity